MLNSPFPFSLSLLSSFFTVAFCCFPVFLFSALSLSEAVPHSFSFRYFRSWIASCWIRLKAYEMQHFVFFPPLYFGLTLLFLSHPASTIFVFALKIFLISLFSSTGWGKGWFSFHDVYAIYHHLFVASTPETYTRAKVYIQMHGIYFQVYLWDKSPTPKILYTAESWRMYYGCILGFLRICFSVLSWELPPDHMEFYFCFHCIFFLIKKRKAFHLWKPSPFPFFRWQKPYLHALQHLTERSWTKVRRGEMSTIE